MEEQPLKLRMRMDTSTDHFSVRVIQNFELKKKLLFV